MLKKAKDSIDVTIHKGRETEDEMQKIRLEVLAQKRQNFHQYRAGYIEYVNILETKPELISKKMKQYAQFKKNIIDRI